MVSDAFACSRYQYNALHTDIVRLVTPELRTTIISDCTAVFLAIFLLAAAQFQDLYLC